MMVVCSEVLFSAAAAEDRFDSEYYDPIFLENEDLLRRSASQRLDSITPDIRCGPFGSTIKTSDYCESGIPLIRVSDTSEAFLRTDDLVFVSQSALTALNRYVVTPGDIVVSQRGTVAQFSLVPEDYDKWIISANLISIRKSEEVDNKYLLAFLNSTLGKLQLKRKQSGQVQPKIITEDIKSIQMPKPSKKLESKVVGKILQSEAHLKQSSAFYARAAELLLGGLGLSDLDLSPTRYYTHSVSESLKVNRLDAEYFQPKYYRLLDKLKKAAQKLAGDTIGNLSEPLKYGTSDKLTYVSEGVPFLRIADLENRRFEMSSVLRIPMEEAIRQKSARVKTGDVLVSRSGTLGLGVAIPEELNDAVFGSYFIRLKPNKERVNPEYLAFYINALCGKMQVERVNTGCIQTNLTIPAIKSIFVVFGDRKWQNQYVDILAQSVTTRKKFRQLLGEAIHMVEAGVLKGAK